MADPLKRAEQALLGAVLLDPAQLDRLTWLHPGDFYHPAHSALFGAARDLMSERPDSSGPVSVAWPNAVLAGASARTRGLSSPYLHTLISLCPHAHHAPVYGRMVLEGSVHRSVLQHAVRLSQTARAASALRDIGIVNAVQHTEDALGLADALSRHLDTVARRWGSTPRTTTSAPPPPSGAAEAQRDEELAEYERDLVASLVERPAKLGEVPWLRPDDFAEYGDLFHCVQALVHRGEPVDSMTLAWEARRRGLLDGDGNRRIDAVRQGPGAGGADWLGERVVRAALLRTLSEAARRVQGMAGDPGYPPGRLVQHSHLVLDASADVRARWLHAHTGRPPTPPHRPRSGAQQQVNAARARSRSSTSPPPVPAPPRPTTRREGPTR